MMIHEWWHRNSMKRSCRCLL